MEESQLIRMIKDYDTQLLGMAPCYVTMNNTLDIAEILKKEPHKIWTCLGGHHSTFCADEILRNEKSIDFIIRGEGERTILDLVKIIESNWGGELSLETLSSIYGLSFRFGETVIHNDPRALIEDLDDVPFPVRDPLDRVLTAGQHAMPLVCTSRGCPAYCSFCSTPEFYGRRWRPRSSENIVDEIQEIVEKYGFTQFYLTDDQFVGHGEKGRLHVRGLIDEIKRRQLHLNFNLHFFIMMSASFFCNENEDLIREFPDVGFRDIFIGFESSDPTQLNLYKKRGSQEQYLAALKMAQYYNIFVEGGFIIFNPYTTFDSLKRDSSFIKKVGVPLFGYYTKELMVFPGTRLYRKLIRDGMMLEHDYKHIRFKYRDNRISEFHKYLSDFFESFEHSDNRLFQTMDFQIKLKGSINRLNDDRIKKESSLFIKKADDIYKKITELNYDFFNKILDLFENKFDNRSGEAFKHDFVAYYNKIVQPIITDYEILNSRIGLIRSSKPS